MGNLTMTTVHTQINAIALNKEFPTVRYSASDADSSTDSVFPGKGSEPVLPTNGFATALDALQAELEAAYSLPTKYEWTLKSLTLIYSEETGECTCFKAQFTGFSPDAGKLTVTIDPQSEQNISADVQPKVEAVISEAIAFVGGASAQGNLFSAADIATAARERAA
jgi:hypothetical protein